MSGRKNEEQIGQVRLGSFRGYAIPTLKQGEEVCPICSQPANKLPEDNKPGRRYRHSGRIFVCRYIPLFEGEVPNA